ncbi:MAG TPA: galactokinase [Polyangiaceae bacterium]|jgi:galactokinase
MTQPFREVFSRVPHVVASAPGRVNLIGEHTDYNGGYVLPMAIPQRTVVELAVRADDVVRLWSANVDHDGRAMYKLATERRTREWHDYVQGVTRALRQAGHRMSGFDARIDSRVPIGRGLSSSAALGVAILRAIREAFDLEIDDVSLALLAHRSENDLVGAPLGVMDPLASSLADDHTGVFIDTRSLRIERVPLPTGTEIAIIDSGVAHSNATGGYKLRREECMAAAEMLGVEQLRDAYRIDKIEALPEPLRRRARHVFSENARVLAAVASMRADDAVALGGLFLESHVSMRDDFEISTPEIDALVMRAASDPMVYGARLTGGGFGGSVVILAHAGHGRAAAERIAREVPGARAVLP